MRGAERLARALESLGAELGLGVGANRGMRILLVMFSMLLSTVSGYTTYTGFGYCLPWVAALLATIGVQGLLFAMCWRIAAAIKSHQGWALLLLMYLMTGSVSVFFSYVGLLTQVYLNEYYQDDAKSALTQQAYETIGKLKTAAQTKIYEASRTGPESEKIDAWTNSVAARLQQDMVQLQSMQAALSAQANSAEAKFNIEYSHGGTRSSGGVTPQGYGAVARRLADLQVDAEQRSEAVGAIVELTSKSVGGVRETLRRTSAYGMALSAPDVADIQAACLAARTAATRTVSSRDITKEESDVCVPPLGVQGLLSPVAPYRAAADSLDAECAPLAEEAWKHGNQIRACVDRAAAAIGYDATRVPSFAFDGEALTGSQSHPIRASFTALSHGNSLVYFTFGLAVVIDGLILLCGIAGAAPSSFLEIQDQRDLMVFRESAVETVFMALALLGSPLDERGESSHLGVLRRLFASMKPYEELAPQGYVAVISREYAESNRLAALIAVLLHLGLIDDAAVVAADVCKADGLPVGTVSAEGYAVRTKLVLWGCQQLADYAVGRRDLPSLIDALRDLSPVLAEHLGASK